MKTRRNMHKRKIQKNKTKKGGFSWPWASQQSKNAHQKVKKFEKCNTIWKRQFTNKSFCNSLHKQYINLYNQTPEQNEQFRQKQLQKYNALANEQPPLINNSDDIPEDNFVTPRNSFDESENDFVTPRNSSGIAGGKRTRTRRRRCLTRRR
jgi:hypothetical protein